MDGGSELEEPSYNKGQTIYIYNSIAEAHLHDLKFSNDNKSRTWKVLTKITAIIVELTKAQLTDALLSKNTIEIDSKIRRKEYPWESMHIVWEKENIND